MGKFVTRPTYVKAVKQSDLNKYLKSTPNDRVIKKDKGICDYSRL